jgi:hypothetical protein
VRLRQAEARRGSRPGCPCSGGGDRAAATRRTWPPGAGEEPPTLPRIPDTKAEIEALGWEELKALVLAYPEVECLPEEKRKSWLSERWVGLTQAHRDAFRAALDADDTTRADHSIV